MIRSIQRSALKATLQGAGIKKRGPLSAFFSQLSNQGDNDLDKKDEIQVRDNAELQKPYSYYPEAIVALINSDKFIAKILK